VNARTGLFAALLLASGCATAPGGAGGRKRVAAVGRGADAESALADAQKRAVEKALGVSISASTRVEGAVAVRRRIWADARGRVESWTVLDARKEEGLSSVRIRASVIRLADGEEVPPPSDTTVRIEAAGPAGQGLRRGFGARGFTVVEKGGDYVVRARSTSELLHDPRTSPFVSGRARVLLSIVDSRTGAVVAERASEAGSLASDALSASSSAVGSAGELGGREAADGLSRLLWSR
jgi:hypothetical protein